MDNYGDAGQKFHAGLARPSFLRAAGAIAASTISAGLQLPAFAQQDGSAPAERLVAGRRKLGKLGVSSVGLGCQDMTVPGTTKMPHLLDNLGADGVRFSAAEIRELNTALAPVPVHGARLSPGLLRLSGVEAAPKQ